MATWFLLNGQTIQGWQSGSQAPDGAPLASDADIAAYRSARDSMASTGRSDMPQLIDGIIIVPTDARPIFRVSCDRAPDVQLGHPVIEANGVDSVLVTVEKMLDAATVDTGFNGILYFETANRTFRIAFINGAGTKQFASSVSGRYDVTSRPTFKVVQPLVIIAAE